MSKFSLVVMASGQGTNFMAIAEAVSSGRIPAAIAGLVVNNPKAKVIHRARELNIPIFCVNHRDFEDYEQWDLALAQALKELNPDLIILAGFLRKIGPQVLAEFSGRMLNTHPSLLPAYGGPGMYGSKIHQAVIAAGEAVTGVSIHRVTSDYDSGPVVAQVALKISPQTSADQLEDQVKGLEHQFLSNVVEKTVRAKLNENN